MILKETNEAPIRAKLHSLSPLMVLVETFYLFKGVILDIHVGDYIPKGVI